jgi:hypothetical protein
VVFVTFVVYAAMLQAQRRVPEAEAQLIDAYRGLIAGQREASLPIQLVVTWLVSLYGESGQPTRAAEWRAKVMAPAADALVPTAGRPELVASGRS